MGIQLFVSVLGDPEYADPVPVAEYIRRRELEALPPGHAHNALYSEEEERTRLEAIKKSIATRIVREATEPSWARREFPRQYAEGWVLRVSPEGVCWINEIQNRRLVHIGLAIFDPLKL